MKITCLLENTSRQGWPVEHGLSLHLETTHLSLLFDMGQSHLFAENAHRLGIDLNSVQVAILSHGHYDHGGGLPHFLALNHHAPVYLHHQAFEPHYSLRDNGLRYIGLDTTLQAHPQLRFCHDETLIQPGITLFAQVKGRRLCPPGNRLLFGPSPEVHDDFAHEQSLLIEAEGRCVLLAGCAHTGLLNILERAQQLAKSPITHVFAGMHLKKSGLPALEEARFIQELADQLLQYPQCEFYTMHCTGQEAYLQLKQHMESRLHYLSCGDEVIF